ncbi:MAG: ferritin family protein [bacterium]
MTEYSSFDALRKALDFEEEGIKYYTTARERTEHPSARSVFGMLIEQERTHVEYLSLLHERLKAQDKWPREVTVNLEKDFKPLFRDAAGEVDDRVKITTNELEALAFAVEMENRGREMYDQLSGAASDPLEKEFYDISARWEQNHAEFVESFYNYSEDMGLRTEGDSGL